MKTTRIIIFSIFISILFTLSSCSEDKVIHAFKLETLHVGNGGGDWSGREFSKTVLFRKDGTVEFQNGNNCNWGDRDDSQFGRYDETKIYTDCNGDGTESSRDYEISENELTIVYSGIEYTYEMYIKI